MKISLGEVLASKEGRIDFDYQVDLSNEKIGSENPFKTSVRIVGSLQDKSGMNELTAEITARPVVSCARCLTSVEYDKTTQVTFLLTRKVDNEELDDIIFIESDEVDLDELLVPELILDMETVVLCKEDCKGLCPKCGKDLNEGDCGCDRRVVDPRMAKLLDYLK